MVYDFDGATDKSAPKVVGPVYQSTDLEVIVMLLELAAIELSPEVGSTFSEQRLIETTREIGGPDISLAEKDIKIVLSHMKSLKKIRGKYILR